MSQTAVPDPLADLLAARDRARDAFRAILLRLQAAAATPEGVTRTLEEECARIRAAWKDAEARLDAHLSGAAPS